MPNAVRSRHIYVPKGNWFSITEFQEIEHAEDERVVGGIAIDATSSRSTRAPSSGTSTARHACGPQARRSRQSLRLRRTAPGFAARRRRTSRPDPAPRSFTPYAGTPIQSRRLGVRRQRSRISDSDLLCSHVEEHDTSGPLGTGRYRSRSRGSYIS